MPRLRTPALIAVTLAATLSTIAAAEVIEINQSGITFVPDQVTAAPGDTIRWIHGGGGHTVTSGTDCVFDEVHFDLPLDSGNPIAEYVIPAEFTGDIPYFCRPHCGLAMIGNVTVEAPCVGDLDDSGAVNVTDLLELLAQWGGPGSADFDDSGTVNVTDLLTLLANWGPCPAP